jgi:hypothetical protein
MKIDVHRFARFLVRLFSKAAEKPDQIRGDIEGIINLLNIIEVDPQTPASLKPLIQQGRKRLRWILDALNIAAVLGEL